MFNAEGVTVKATLQRILRRHPLAIGAAGHALHPRLVVEIPLDRLADPTLKRLARLPAEFGLDFARVDSVAAIVSRTIGNELDQVAMRSDRVVWRQFVKYGTDSVHDVQILDLIAAAYVVGFAGTAPRQHVPNRVGRAHV